MHPKSSKKLCPGCAEAAEIVQQVQSMTNDRPFDAGKTINGLPMLLESAVSYLLSDFDYQANIASNTAIAIRIVAACVAQTQCLQVYCAELTQE